MHKNWFLLTSSLIVIRVFVTFIYSSQLRASVGYCMGLVYKNILEQFSIECRKTKPKVFTLTNHKENRQTRYPNKLKPNVAGSRRGKLCASDSRYTIGFGFTSDWLRKWREFFEPINKRSNTKPQQTQITFDCQVKLL